MAAERNEFMAWLEGWLAARPTLSMEDLVAHAGGPEGVGIFCTDMTECFTRTGRLASPRIAGIIPAIVNLFTRAHEVGITTFLLTEDSHPPDSPEFDAYGPHCITGTPESRTIPELTGLPFAHLLRIIPKRTLNPALFSDLWPWLEQHGVPPVAIVCGNCTDICVYQLSLHMRNWANGMGRHARIVVPADCVQTYSVSTTIAAQVGALPHPGDFLHQVFLYHLALNGMEVVAAVAYGLGARGSGLG